MDVVMGLRIATIILLLVSIGCNISILITNRRKRSEE